MLSASSTTRFFAGLFFLSLFSTLNAQENAPFSRYGLGDVYPSQHIASRAMGGLAAAFQNPQAINSANPATYSGLRFIDIGNGLKGGLVSYDIGLTVDTRTLRSNTPSDKFNSVNFIPSYVQIGIPLSKRLERSAGLVFGLRPLSRISYGVEERVRTSIDSMQTIYEGSGGVNQAFVGLGKRFGNISLGVNFGYEFGQRNIGTKISFLNDSVLHYKSNSTDSGNFGGLFINPGLFGFFKISEVKKASTNNTETWYLNLGASGTFEHTLNASKSINRQTFFYSGSGELIQIDSVYKQPDIEGEINMPLSYTAGFMLTKTIANTLAARNKFSIGADYSATQWTNFRNFGLPDQLNDSWRISVGSEFTPDPINGVSFWSRSTYRLGFYTGKNYINADNNGYKEKAISLGTSFNLRKFRSYDNQYTLINTAFEFGKRGSDVNNVTESFFKFSAGLSLSDLWFIRRKYD